MTVAVGTQLASMILEIYLDLVADNEIKIMIVVQKKKKKQHKKGLKIKLNG